MGLYFSIIEGINMDIKKLSYKANLSELEKGVLDFIIENESEIHKFGVRDIAKHTFTSPATVVRLSKKLGFSGFTDFIFSVTSKSTELDLEPIIVETYSPLDSLYKNNDIETINNIKEVLNDRESLIFIYAAGFSGIVAEYFYKKLLVRGNNVMFSDSADSVAVFENRMSQIKTFLVISKSGNTPEIIDKAIRAKESGIRVISISGSSKSKLSDVVDSQITLSKESSYDDRNRTSSFFFGETIVVFEHLLD